MPRWVWYVIIAVFVLWAIGQPAAAGTDVHGWIHDVTTFFTHLARG